MTNPDCIFCGIAKGRIPASVVTDTASAVAFIDINQPTPGHILIIPRAHVEDIYGLDQDTAAAIFDLTVRVARAVRDALHPDGLNLFQSNGRAGQQEVFHFHMHVVARYAGDRDRIRFGWRSELPPREELARLATEIRAALQA